MVIRAWRGPLLTLLGAAVVQPAVCGGLLFGIAAYRANRAFQNTNEALPLIIAEGIKALAGDDAPALDRLVMPEDTKFRVAQVALPPDHGTERETAWVVWPPAQYRLEGTFTDLTWVLTIGDQESGHWTLRLVPETAFDRVAADLDAGREVALTPEEFDRLMQEPTGWTGDTTYLPRDVPWTREVSP